MEFSIEYNDYYLLLFISSDNTLRIDATFAEIQIYCRPPLYLLAMEHQIQDCTLCGPLPRLNQPLLKKYILKILSVKYFVFTNIKILYMLIKFVVPILGVFLDFILEGR